MWDAMHRPHNTLKTSPLTATQHKKLNQNVHVSRTVGIGFASRSWWAWWSEQLATTATQKKFAAQQQYLLRIPQW